jgi:biopolymer transport protein ExbD
MRFLDEEADVSPEINIVPMIDAIFAILAFFIVSTLYLTRSEGLPVNLPQASSSERQESTEATITIDATAQIFLNREPIALADLTPAIESLKADTDEFLVIINADEAVNHGEVIGVMDQVRQIVGVRLAIATVEP